MTLAAAPGEDETGMGAGCCRAVLARRERVATACASAEGSESRMWPLENVDCIALSSLMPEGGMLIPDGNVKRATFIAENRGNLLRLQHAA